MSGSGYAEVLDLATGAVLVCAIVTLWRRDLRAIVSVLSLQGLALGIVAGVLAAHDHDIGLGVTAAIVFVVKGFVIPVLLRKVVSRDPGSRETSPLINVPASLVAAAVLVVISYLASGKIIALVLSPASRLAPIGIATVLVGFLVLVTRRKTVSQIVGLLLVDNGVALVAFLLTAGVPLVVELGASLDVLLVVAVLRVLATALRAQFGAFDLDQLRELHD
jgi:hydrogenase-4 component E